MHAWSKGSVLVVVGGDGDGGALSYLEVAPQARIAGHGRDERLGA